MVVIKIEQSVIFDTTIFGILAKEENSGEKYESFNSSTHVWIASESE